MCQRKFRPIKYTRRYSYEKFGTFFGPPGIMQNVLEELEETTSIPSYYVNEDYPAGPHIPNLSLNEAIDVAQNHPLWRLMSTFLALCTTSGACQKRRSVGWNIYWHLLIIAFVAIFVGHEYSSYLNLRMSFERHLVIMSTEAVTGDCCVSTGWFRCW